MNEERERLIKHMVDRFLGWHLPEDFRPDGGVSYVRPNYPPQWGPSGTNLLDARQAEAMVRHMVEGMPDTRAPAAPAPDAQAGLREQIAHYLTKRAGKVVDQTVYYETLSDGFKWAIREMPKDGPAPHWKTMPAWEWWGGQQADDILALVSRVPQPAPEVEGCHKLDTPERVFFYEQDFYVLSNFSAFQLVWDEMTFHTSEAAYQWEKFRGALDYKRRKPGGVNAVDVMDAIRLAPSAHEAFKLAERFRSLRRPDWDDVKVDAMRDILRAKSQQHEYVRRKLMATGDRELIEDSWRDDFWGWGPDKNGANMLGKLWMEIRSELRAKDHP